MFQFSLLVGFLFLLLKLTSSLDDVYYSFTLYGLMLDSVATMNHNDFITVANNTQQQTGHVFSSQPLQFKNLTSGNAFSFSTNFVFEIHCESSESRGHGFALVFLPSKDLPGAQGSQYLGIFNESNNGDPSNHIVAVELDTIYSKEFEDVNDNHVGIDINGLRSIKSAPAGYYAGSNGGFRDLSLRGEKIQVWVEYDGLGKQLNITVAPLNMTKPNTPLLSLTEDLSPFILDNMYLGFSSSSRSSGTFNFIWGWKFSMNGQVLSFNSSDFNFLLSPPGSGIAGGGGEGKKSKGLAIGLSMAAGVVFLLVLLAAFVIVRRKINFEEVVEDWEVQYGPHRFAYKDLYSATKGFSEKELLGRGGFGQVYHGVLPTSKIEIAVKRVSHDSKQGMREFVAEIATIGRLRHPNLVRLLGYCRRKGELFLVYDFMPNGSLDKFLFNQPKVTINWPQRFKIIKDVASGLHYLHQQWVQVVVHRDIKASNVVIDGEMNGRLGDFGLAKLYDHGTDPQTSNLAGTLGYIAPELVRAGKPTTRTDLYAFGAFLLEVACGRRPVDTRAPPEEIVLMDWVTECWTRGDISKAADAKLGNDFVVEEMELVLKLGLLCSHPVAAVRPTMPCVVQCLEGNSPLPENFSAEVLAIEHSRSHMELSAPQSSSSEKDTALPLTMTEPFISHGR